MSNLVSPFDAILKAAASAPIDPSLLIRPKRLNPSGRDRILLLDCSGSMSEIVPGTGMKKIEILRDAIDLLNLSEWRIIAFSSSAFEILPNQIPSPDGGTNLACAIELIAKKYNPRETLIISDGIPDCKNEAIAAAQKLPGMISTLYIGSDRYTEAIEFLRRLARLGCGRSHTQDLSEGAYMLSSSIKMLGAS